MSRTVLARSMLLVLFWFVGAIAGCGTRVDTSATSRITEFMREACVDYTDSELASLIVGMEAAREATGYSRAEMVVAVILTCQNKCADIFVLYGEAFGQVCFDSCSQCAVANVDAVY